MRDMVFISKNVPSLKNSKVATSRGIFASKTVGKYLRLHGIQHYSSSRKVVDRYKTIPMTFPIDALKKLFEGAEYPVKIGFHFVRNSARDFDFNNSTQILLDLFTAFDLIPDDSMRYVLPFPLEINGKYYSIDKENPGCYVTILK